MSPNGLRGSVAPIQATYTFAVYVLAAEPVDESFRLCCWPSNRDHVMPHAVAEVAEIGIAAHIVEGQHDTSEGRSEVGTTAVSTRAAGVQGCH